MPLFCTCLKINTVETSLLLQEAFENEVLGVSTIKRWCKIFLDRREMAEFEPRGPDTFSNRGWQP